MKLNMGCGFRKKPGYINVDKENLCHPDQLVDLESLPWPWADNSFTEIHAEHILEHLGERCELWIGIIKEMWRVSTPDARWAITVPHPRHDYFIFDPTHVRAITPNTMAMFDNDRNFKDLQNNGIETKLGLYAAIDLEVTEIIYDPAVAETSTNKAELEIRVTYLNNVCEQIRMLIRPIKPARGAGWVQSQLSRNDSPHSFNRAATPSPETRSW